jgi:hypothetical protein
MSQHLCMYQCIVIIIPNNKENWSNFFKVYISSGMVSDPTIDVIEVIDFNTQTIDIFKKLGL